MKVMEIDEREKKTSPMAIVDFGDKMHMERAFKPEATSTIPMEARVRANGSTE
jgi:hypothetical protein